MAKDHYIYGRNAIIESLQNTREISKVYVSFRAQGSSINTIYTLAKRNRIPIVKSDSRKFRELEQKAGTNEKASQGVIGLKEIVKTVPFDNLIEQAFGKSERPILVALDQIEDPQNLGAIARTLEASAAAGLIITSDNSAQITPATLKASTGAIDMIDIARVRNLPESLQKAKEEGWEIIGTDMKAKHNYFDNIWQNPTILIIGSEGRGMSPEVREVCDKLVQIPMPGKIESLNASVSTAIILFEINRQG
jgi:23S rRNA (guanosine2251-2'-O)-methyltransferase